MRTGSALNLRDLGYSPRSRRLSADPVRTAGHNFVMVFGVRGQNYDKVMTRVELQGGESKIGESIRTSLRNSFIGTS